MPGRVFLRNRPDAAPGESFELMCDDGERREMRWGMIPVGRKNARGRPVMETIINARSETVFDKTAYSGTRRAVLKVEGWYEWTGEKRHKTRWAITLPGEALHFAAIWDIWRSPSGREMAQFATLTCPPNEDLKDIHHRMPVILQDQADVWLSGTEEDAAKLLKSFPDGRLKIEKSSLA
ncbi:MAG: SOS response-associated peptidase family protein [Pseudomonadota bacterium]